MQLTGRVDQDHYRSLSTIYAIKMCVRLYLNTDNPQLLENIKDILEDNILKDGDVLFYWCLIVEASTFCLLLN